MPIAAKSVARAANVGLLAVLAGLAITAAGSTPAHAQPRSRERPAKEGASEARRGRAPETIRLGVIGGVGFPRPLAVEGLMKFRELAAVGIEYGFLPSTQIGGVEAELWAIALDARLFPFENGFFVGVRGGRQVLDARATFELAPFGRRSESVRAETWFFNPRAGFLWTWQSGVTFGIDAGVQIPIGATASTTLPAGLSSSVDGIVATTTAVLGNRVTPTVDLLRLGVLF